MPSGRRISEPVRIGVATSRPNSVSLRLSSVLIFTPMTENITQTAKLTAKAIVLAVSAEICSRLYAGLLVLAVVTVPPFWLVDHLATVRLFVPSRYWRAVDGDQNREARSATEGRPRSRRATQRASLRD